MAGFQAIALLLTVELGFQLSAKFVSNLDTFQPDYPHQSRLWAFKEGIIQNQKSKINNRIDVVFGLENLAQDRQQALFHIDVFNT